MNYLTLSTKISEIWTHNKANWGGGIVAAIASVVFAYLTTTGKLPVIAEQCNMTTEAFVGAYGAMVAFLSSAVTAFISPKVKAEIDQKATDIIEKLPVSEQAFPKMKDNNPKAR